eukprot:11922336-Alexandrium_andersonii.AAC.1
MAAAVGCPTERWPLRVAAVPHRPGSSALRGPQGPGDAGGCGGASTARLQQIASPYRRAGPL